MGNLKARPHFSVAIDWQSRTIEQWLEQYGSWLLLDSNNVSLGAKSTLAYICESASGVKVDRRRRSLPRCNISVYEAMAIEDLLAHAHQTENKKVLQWFRVATMYYVAGLPEEYVAEKWDITMYTVKRDKMAGILRLATRFKLRSFLTE